MSKSRNYNKISPDKSSRSRKPSAKETSALQKAQKRIARQAALALLTVVLTVVLIFAMTSAWYTNIVQTSGLTFQAEAWGFSGTITLDVPTVIKAGPGDEGIIGLTVTNNEKTITDININVNKSEMAEEMKQRLYFYADAQLTRNGETMERVYLNNRDNYTYTLFSNGTLRLSEELHNDALLKWQWVYDVLGYYVIGRYDAATGQMTVEEYLRPIEYDYDEATTTFEKVSTLSDGTEIYSNVLSTVDGTTTVSEFLKALSKKDGYAGEINTDIYAEVGRAKYYPVDAAGYKNGTYSNGYGIYAYLCNYSEIQAATEFDTALGQAAYQLETTGTITNVEGITTAEQLVSKAKLTISAQKSESHVISVTNAAALKQAMAMENVDVIQLSDDINLTDDPLVIPAGQRLMLDLNGNQIISVIETDATNKIAIKAQPGSSLTILNGEIVGKLEKDLTQTDPNAPTESTDEEAQTVTSAGYAIYSTGAEVVLSDVDVKDFKYGIYVGDSDNDNTLDSRIYLTGSTIDVTSNAVIITGNGYASAQKSQLIIEDSKLYSDGITISGNGTTAGNGRWGTDIQIIESEIVSRAKDDITKAGAGIYHPQKDSNLTIYNSKVSGYTGIALKGGTVTITKGSTIIGYGATVMEPKFFTSGFADTADAVYIETNYGYDIHLTIDGASKLTTENVNAKSLQVYDPDALNYVVKIISGIFDEAQPAAWIAEGSVQDGTNVTVQTGTATTDSDDPEAVS